MKVSHLLESAETWKVVYSYLTASEGQAIPKEIHGDATQVKKVIQKIADGKAQKRGKIKRAIPQLEFDEKPNQIIAYFTRDDKRIKFMTCTL